MPQHFTGSHSKYTNNICWVKNTYYLPFDEHIPTENGCPSFRNHVEYPEDAEILYYQWLPFILLGQVIYTLYMPLKWKKPK